MPGPNPKPADQRRRRNSTPGARVLPSTGNTFTPPWPLRDANETELQLWGELWRTPQAAAWSKMDAGVYRVVARYVRLVDKADALMVGGGDQDGSSLLPEIRQLEDRLGLSPVALLRLQWTIDERDDLEDKRGSSEPKGSKDRMRLVDSSAVAGA